MVLKRDILGATGSTYTVVSDDGGKRLKVKVSFIDTGGFSEGPLASDATVTVLSASAITLVDNFDFSLVPDFAILNITDTVYVSQEFTTGNHTKGYEIEIISLNLKSIHSLSGFSVSIHDVSVDVPGVKLYQLYGPANRTGRQSFSASSGAVIVLDANTKYFVVLSASANPRSAQVYFSNSTSESVSVDGWSIADEYMASTDGGNSWTSNSFTQFPVVISVVGSRVTNRVASGKPVINGTVQVGQTLTVDTSGIRDQDGIPSSFTYQWVRVDSGTETDILGATGSTYTVVSDDGGKRLKVKVSFIDTGGFSEGPLASDATVTVLSASAITLVDNFDFSLVPDFAILNITDTVYVSQEFTTGNHTKGYEIEIISLNLKSIHSLSGFSVSIHDVSVDVPGVKLYQLYGPANRTGRQSFSASSGAVIVLDANTKYFVVLSASANPRSAQVYFSNSTSESVSVDGWSIADEYMASTDGGNSWTSNSFTQFPVVISVVGSRVTNRVASGKPVINGTVQVGQTLTVDTSGIRDQDGVPSSFSYQWVRVDSGTETDILGATGSNYTVVSDDGGKRLKVKVSFVDVDGFSEGPLASDATVTVPVNSLPVFTSSSSFSVNENSVAVGTVVAVDFDGSDNVTSYGLGTTSDKTFFNLDFRSGVLTFSFAPNYESPADSGGNNVYNLMVSVTSGTGGRVRSASQSITVTVNDVAEPPSAPSAPVLSSPSSTSLLVSWSAPSNTGPAIGDYDVGYGRNSNGPFTDWPHSGTSRSATITGLNASTLYFVRVLARNVEGSSGWSPTASFTTGSTSPPPETNNPPIFTINSSFSVNENTFIVGTVVASDSDSQDNVTGYSVSGGADRVRLLVRNGNLLVFRFAPDYESPVDSGGNNVYNLIITASSGAGSRVLTATHSITVTVVDVDEAPSAPSAPVLSSPSSTSLSVSWSAPSNTGPAISDYDVQYRNGTVGSFRNSVHNGNGTSTTIPGLNASTLYQVQVRAVNDEGNSGWSPTASFTTGSTSPPPNNPPVFFEQFWFFGE